MTRTARLVRLLAGLVIIAIAFAMTVRAHLGLGPLHVLQQGAANHLGISLGTAGIGLNAVLFLGALWLRERPGLGTLGTTVLGGVFLDVALLVVPEPDSLWLRGPMLAGGLVVMSFGAALYLSADLGAGPYDAVMTGLYRRLPFRLYSVRLAMEVVAFLAGWAAGGEVGIGCLVIGFGIGPGIELWLRVLGALPAKAGAPSAGVAGEAAVP